MARLTIAQLREIELNKLSEITKDQDKARNMMNRYYRLCGMDERLLYLENDERWHDKQSTKDLEAQRDQAWERRNKDFNDYGMKLTYFGYLPTITNKEDTTTAINAYYYQR